MKFDWSLISRALGEFTGTAMLLCLGCMGCISSGIFPNSILQMGINWGLVIMACVHCFGCVSGGHVNPCVTLAAIIVGHIKWDIGLVYIVCQFLGAIVGYLMVKFIPPKTGLGDVDNYFCVTIPHSAISDITAFGIEFILTATLIFGVCAVWDKRNAELRDGVPIKIGLLVGMLFISGGAFTGCSINPARTLAPAIINGVFSRIWIYFAAQFSSAIGIAFAWKFLYNGEGPGGAKSSGGGDEA